MTEHKPRIEYETDDKGRVRPTVIGGNGEVQARLEWYDNRSNADRGLADLFQALAATVSVAPPEEDDAA